MYGQGPESKNPPARWSPAQPSASAAKHNQYDKLPSDDVGPSQTLQAASSSQRHQYDELPSSAELQSFQPHQTSNGQGNQYDELPSPDDAPQRNRSPHSPYGTPIFVEDGSTRRRPVNAPARPAGGSNAVPPRNQYDRAASPQSIAEARSRSAGPGFLPDARPRDIAAAGPRIAKPSAPESPLPTTYLPQARMPAPTRPQHVQIPDVGDARKNAAPSTAEQRQHIDPANGHYVVETTDVNGIKGQNTSKVMKLSGEKMFSGTIIAQKINGGLIIKDAENPSDLVHLPASAGKQLSQYKHNQDIIDQSIVNGRDASVNVYHSNGQWSVQAENRGNARTKH